MVTFNFSFNSQVCTTVNQSNHLLNLGLNPETADMIHSYEEDEGWTFLQTYVDDWCLGTRITSDYLPAWSLSRLMELCPKRLKSCDFVDRDYILTITPDKIIYKNDFHEWLYTRDDTNLFNRMIGMIEWLITNNYLDKKYLL